MHKSVLLSEAVEALHVENGKKYIDATLGAGGHTLEILRRGGKVLGIEADPKMLAIATLRLGATEWQARMKLVLGNFRDIASIAHSHGFGRVSGILFDLGISSYHLDEDQRGFSFKDPGAPLDMRINPETQGVTAADLLNSLDTTQLTKLFESKGIARKVVEFRKVKNFSTVGDLLTLFGPKRKRVHPATKAFMMLRIAVNSEYDSLSSALPQAVELLEKGGRLVVISFHSGEDRIVKKYFVRSDLILPNEEEIARNPRARSARMRVLTKV